MSVHPGWPEDLGPLRVPAGVVTVRPVKLRDAAVWSRLRIRDREHLEPWEPTGESPWDARHHITVWPSLCGNLRSEARKIHSSFPIYLKILTRSSSGWNSCKLEEEQRIKEFSK